MNCLPEINVSQFGFHYRLSSVSIQFRLSVKPLCIFYLISFLSRIRFFYKSTVTPNTTLEGFPFYRLRPTFGIHGIERRFACVSTHYMTSTAQRFLVIMAKFLPHKTPANTETKLFSRLHSNCLSQKSKRIVYYGLLRFLQCSVLKAQDPSNI
jgi:hypothetical protein